MNFIEKELIKKLFECSKHRKCMYLSIFIEDDIELKNKYIEAAKNHNKKLLEDLEFYDSGFDIFLPRDIKKIDGKQVFDNTVCFFGHEYLSVNKVDFKIKCSAGIFYIGKYIRTNLQILNHSTGFYIYPRSSLSKTPLRLANSTGIIDAGYRGNIIGMFDVVNIVPNQDSECDYYAEAYDRLLQICAPSLVPIYVNIVNTVEELGPNTTRSGGGFGSTGR